MYGMKPKKKKVVGTKGRMPQSPSGKARASAKKKKVGEAFKKAIGRGVTKLGRNMKKRPKYGM